jgi:hypothetical protein
VATPVLTRNFEKGRGSFHPFTYSIGLPGTLQEAIGNAPAYPLPQPVSDEMMAQLVTTLTFAHEALRLAQYTSCSFGLRTLRRSLIALHYLEKRHWEQPIGTKLLQKVTDGTADDLDRRMLIRILSFLEAAQQLRLSVESLSEPPLMEGDALCVDFEPWTAYFHLRVADAEHPNVFETREGRHKWAAELDRIGVQIHQLPVLYHGRADGCVALTFNAAALMEGYALMYELNSLHNALGRQVHEMLESVVPSGTEYLASAEYALRSGACNLSNFVLTVEILTDVALMYDPFILFNSPSVEKPSAGQVPDQLPGVTFLHACEAAKRLRPITEYDPDDLRRYYRELCRELGFPSPKEMAQKAHEVVSSLQRQIPSGSDTSVWLAGAIEMHAAALEVRLQDPELFPVHLATGEGIFDVLTRCGSHVSIYHIDELEPTSTFPEANRTKSWCENMDLLMLHSLLVDCFVADRIDCPLKKGDPFWCQSATGAAGDLCAFQIDGRTIGECLVDVFERRYGLARC